MDQSTGGSQRRGGSHYTRSSAGMIGAMIVTVGVILAFVAFRAINRDDLDFERETVDYLPAVQALQDSSEVRLAYPSTLPEGMRAVDVEGSVSQGYSLDILTEDKEFIGIYQGVKPVDDWVKEYVDKKAEQGDEITVNSKVASRWQEWSDTGGDYAVTAELDDSVVMVWGTADEDDIRDVAGRLVTDKLR